MSFASDWKKNSQEMKDILTSRDRLCEALVEYRATLDRQKATAVQRLKQMGLHLE
jgi:hypothetical protein